VKILRRILNVYFRKGNLIQNVPIGSIEIGSRIKQRRCQLHHEERKTTTAATTASVMV